MTSANKGAERLDLVHIVDFDGTIYRGNSFHHWLLYLFGVGLVTGCPKLSIALVRIGFGRLLHRHSHATFKLAVQRLWQSVSFTESKRLALCRRFNRFQEARLRKDLLEEISARGGRIVLATAAPCDYMVGLCDVVGWDALLCTSYQSENYWVDNVRENKLRSVSDWLNQQGLMESARKILYTDHSDDFCLLELVDEVVLVGRIGRTDLNVIRERFPLLLYRVVS